MSGGEPETPGTDVHVVGANGCSGTLDIPGKAQRMVIRGSLLGGAGDASGALLCGDEIGSVSITGNGVGGSSRGNASESECGCIRARRIGALTTGGSVLAGVDNISVHEV